jgi:hypothetical protein
MDTLAIGASMQEYRNTVVNTTYQFLLKTHGLQAHPTDMGRCVLMYPHSRVGVSTRTASITQLAGALQQAAANALHSQDTFDINSPL